MKLKNTEVEEALKKTRAKLREANKRLDASEEREDVLRFTVTRVIALIESEQPMRAIAEGRRVLKKLAEAVDA